MSLFVALTFPFRHLNMFYHLISSPKASLETNPDPQRRKSVLTSGESRFFLCRYYTINLTLNFSGLLSPLVLTHKNIWKFEEL